MSDTSWQEGPDSELGGMLREYLNGPDPESFMARMRMVVWDRARENALAILASWARTGLVAAGLAAAILGWMAFRSWTPASPASASVSVQVVVAGQQTASELLVAALMEGR